MSLFIVIVFIFKKYEEKNNFFNVSFVILKIFKRYVSTSSTFQPSAVNKSICS